MCIQHQNILNIMKKLSKRACFQWDFDNFLLLFTVKYISLSCICGRYENTVYMSLFLPEEALCFLCCSHIFSSCLYINRTWQFEISSSTLQTPFFSFSALYSCIRLKFGESRLPVWPNAVLYMKLCKPPTHDIDSSCQTFQ